jgi:thiosulfate/3-mercaptopyruvate sulfurtransferase
VSDLARLLAAGDVRVVDVRWKLGDPSAGANAYAAGHVPGAIFADVERDLASEAGERGRHPLPSAEAFAATAARLGIGDGTRVVAYDDMGGATAARLWFLLRYFGHETGAVLDGGIQAFVAAGNALDVVTPSYPRPEPPFRPEPRPEMVLDKSGVVAWLARPGTRLLDARAPERYRGEVEPIDPRAGHIPGAVNAPFAGNLTEGRFLPPEALRARYAALGAEAAGGAETAVYCGSGVTACHDLLALALAGNEAARLYAGSWSEWARGPDAKVAIG